MTEQEFYTYCNLYLNEVRTTPPREGEQRTFILTSIYETETNMGSMTSIVDPGLQVTEQTMESFSKLTWSQQTVVVAAPQISNIIKKVTQEVIKLHNMVRQTGLSIEEVIDVFHGSGNKDEFLKQLAKAHAEAQS